MKKREEKRRVLGRKEKSVGMYQYNDKRARQKQRVGGGGGGV
jgi:hypothetical protein